MDQNDSSIEEHLLSIIFDFGVIWILQSKAVFLMPNIVFTANVHRPNIMVEAILVNQKLFNLLKPKKILQT